MAGLAKLIVAIPFNETFLKRHFCNIDYTTLCRKVASSILDTTLHSMQRAEPPDPQGPSGLHKLATAVTRHLWWLTVKKRLMALLPCPARVALFIKTAATALTAANLVGTLKAARPSTVFAPTDEAFAKLPAGTVGALLADTLKLTAFPTYHVFAGTSMANDDIKMEGQSAKTAKGADLMISTASGVKLNGTRSVLSSKCGFATLFDPHGGRPASAGLGALKIDIACTNSVIHLNDSVLLPA
jgi:hypothetical protein